MKLPFSKIIITSDEPYSKMWHTQLIYTAFLAKENEVIFINPPKSWKPFNFMTSKKVSESKNLTIIQYLNFFPSSLQALQTLNNKLNEKRIETLLLKEKSNDVLIWHFDSYRNPLDSKHFSDRLRIKRIYHIIDPYYNNPINKQLSELADLIVVTSPRHNKHYEKYKQKVINIPQGIDLQLCNEQLKGRTDFNSQQPYIVFLGTLSDDIDYLLLLKISQTQNLHLVLIGKQITVNSSGDLRMLMDQNNVSYLGVLSPEEFYPVLSKASAGIIAYNEARRSRVCSPLKAINYLVASLPVITNIDCEIPELIDKCIYFADTPESYLKLIEQVRDKNIQNNSPAATSYLNKVNIENSVSYIMKSLK